VKEGTSFFLRLEKGQIAGYEESEEIRLSTDVTIIGRQTVSSDLDAEIPDIKVRDDYVSRGHIRLQYCFDDSCFMVQERDGGSRNGTFINGEQIEPGRPYPLKDGDIIGLARVGEDYRVIFRFRERETTLDGLGTLRKVAAEGLVVDLKARRIWVGNREVPLRKKEFDLLAFLYQKQGEACSKDEIAAEVWIEEGGIVSQETIETTIRRTRAAVEPDPSNPRYIVTLPRYGYRLDL
jgi:pSer/pThr/pTyr-binding forkhead associated (FHA) protein